MTALKSPKLYDLTLSLTPMTAPGVENYTLMISDNTVQPNPFIPTIFKTKMVLKIQNSYVKQKDKMLEFHGLSQAFFVLHFYDMKHFIHLKSAETETP